MYKWSMLHWHFRVRYSLLESALITFMEFRLSSTKCTILHILFEFNLEALFCSLAILDSRVGHTMDWLSSFISVLCHSEWLFHGESCPRIDVVHPGRMCSLPRLRAPGIVPCIISYSRQLPCLLVVWPYYASFLALTVFDSYVFTPGLLRTHSFVFFAVHEIHRIFLSPFIS